jgi:hypothetical protein
MIGEDLFVLKILQGERRKHFYWIEFSGSGRFLQPLA